MNPEFELPVEQVQRHQTEKAELVELTGYILEIVRYIRSADETYTIDQVTQAADDLNAQLVNARRLWLGLLDRHLFVQVAAHVHYAQHADISDKHNALIEALRAGDLENDLIAQFLDTVAEDLETGWESELLESTMSELKLGLMDAAALLAALRGEHVGEAYRHSVARALIRLAGQIATAAPPEDKTA